MIPMPLEFIFRILCIVHLFNNVRNIGDCFLLDFYRLFPTVFDQVFHLFLRVKNNWANFRTHIVYRQKMVLGYSDKQSGSGHNARTRAG